MTYRLGDISGKYESGNLGYAAVSNGTDDPGGASYGKFQLSSRTGTLQRFLQESGYDSQFEGFNVGSSKFNEQWIYLANNDTDFCTAQWQFIHDTLYKPVADLAWSGNVVKCLAVGETLWSMAVQHGRAKSIVQTAMSSYIDDLSDKKSCVDGLFNARIDYIKSLNTLTESVKDAIINNRYSNERLAIEDQLLNVD